jgi:hypothetical protein
MLRLLRMAWVALGWGGVGGGRRRRGIGTWTFSTCGGSLVGGAAFNDRHACLLGRVRVHTVTNRTRLPATPPPPASVCKRRTI